MIVFVLLKVLFFLFIKALIKKPCVSNRETKPVEIWTVGSIPIVNQILSNPKKGGKTLEPIVLGHYRKPEALSLRMPYT